MQFLKVNIVVAISLISLSACSIFGEVNVKEPPYDILKSEAPFELRHYDQLVLVTTKMPKGVDQTRSPFMRLFDYISGDNDKAAEISMTAPVFMKQDENASQEMSFVLPHDFSKETAPRPTNPDVTLQDRKDYTVAVIRFSGLFNQSSISSHQEKLESWVIDQGLSVTGKPQAAGYNPPFTLPFLRRNEIMIPVKRP